MLDLNIEIKHSEQYNDALKNEIIIESIEPDGSISFNLNVINPLYAEVLNEKGFVIIDNKLYQFKNNCFKMFDVQRELNEEDIDFMKKSSTSSFEKRLKVYHWCLLKNVNQI